MRAKGAVNWKTVIGRVILCGATVSALALVMPTGAWAQRAACPAPGDVDMGGDLLFIRGTGIEPSSLGADDLARLPRQQLRIETNDGDVVYEGVALAELVARAGVSMERLRGPLASTVVVAEARDGCRAVYTLAELDADFSDREILLADRKNGAALSPDEGPLRIIMFGETRRSRWPRQVHCLRIERL